MLRSRACMAAAVAVTTVLVGPVATTTAVDVPGDTAFTHATVDRTIRDDRITESSGLAASRKYRGVLYTHNDSGDGPRIFAIGPHGHTRAVLSLSGAGARDWEDIAAGPNRTLWCADIGDNAETREDVQVYRVREPDRLRSQSVDWTRYYLDYPDGRHDAEA